MQENDINLQSKKADVTCVLRYFVLGFHGRQNLLWGGDKEVKTIH
jgi:hypothetical protein